MVQLSDHAENVNAFILRTFFYELQINPKIIMLK